MVVLDQDSIGEIEAMVEAAAAAHRVFFQQAQAGRGLAGIKNGGAGAFDGFHVFGSDGGDAAQALQQVQDQALAAQQRARVVPDGGNGLALF